MRGASVNSFLADCRHALRLYVRTPGASLIAVGVLAIGIAFVGSFLSLYVDLALRPHPGFERSGRLATIGPTLEGRMQGMPSAIVERLPEEMTSIEAAGGLAGSWVLIGPEREEVTAILVTEQFVSGIRPRVSLGRSFGPDDHAVGAAPVVLLTRRFWQQRFGGDPSVLGSTLEIGWSPRLSYSGPPGSSFLERFEPEQDSAHFRIVGVLDASLSAFPADDVSFWVPLAPSWPILRGVPESLPGASVVAFVRRSAGMSVTAVLNEFRGSYGDPDSALPRPPGSELQAIDGIVSNIGVQRAVERQLEMFLVGSLLLAVVAAANVSLFLLGRAPGRRRELGVRLAVGAPVGRIARQLATEAGLLAAVAAVIGLAGSVWLSAFVRGLSFVQDAEWRDVALLDWRVLGLTGLFLLVLTLLVSLGPVVGLKRLGIAASSRGARARASPAQRLAGTAQIAIAGTLAGAAIAFGWYIGALTFGDAGYETRNRVLVSFSRLGLPLPPPDDLSESALEERASIEGTRRRDMIVSIPGVDAAAFGELVPRSRGQSPVALPDPLDPTRTIEVYSGRLAGDFIDLLGYRLLHGRTPDNYEPGVVLVNQALARALWGREDVVGERVPGRPGRWPDAEVIGVLEDLSFGHPAAAVPPYVFSPGAGSSAVVETRLTAAALRQTLDGLITDGAIDAAVNEVVSLAALRNELIAPDRARAYLTIATAALVVLLAGLGFYGTQRYLVGAGRREYAIRAALGAGPAALGRHVLAGGLRLGLPGLLLAGLLAFILVVWLRDDYLSREISAVGVTLAVVIGLVFLLLAASSGPARQVRRLHPAPLLRED